MHEVEMGIPVIGLGNLIVGGSGKSPLAMAIAQHYLGAAIVLRGYGRRSKGLKVVSEAAIDAQMMLDYGDEALMLKCAVPQCIVIVSENRVDGIAEAKRLGARYVILDDAYSKHHIKKLELLIQPKHVANSHCLPAGPYRERLYRDKFAIELVEGRDFFRSIESIEAPEDVVLVSAIARPQRLFAFLPQSIPYYFFEDHHHFTKSELEAILERSKKRVLLVTLKDFVKILPFNLPMQVIALHIELSSALQGRLSAYLKGSIAT